MALALLFARLLLAIVFLVAGLTKLADLSVTQKALRDFAVPEALVRPIGRILPIGEIVLAVALVPRTSACWAALGSLGLLLVFITGISYHLIRGRKPDCHCFGKLHSVHVGPWTLARNTLLAVFAALVAWFGYNGISLSATSWFTIYPLALQVALIAAIIAVALLVGEGWLLLHVLRQQGRLLLRIEQVESRLAQAEMMEDTQPRQTLQSPFP